MARDYRKENGDMYGFGPASSVTKKQQHNRKRKTARNKARAILKKKGVAIAGKDVDHKDGNPLNNNPSNLRAESVSSNRSRNKK
jgi:hypothetical protein